MKRREFIAGLGGAAAWPVAVRAQQAALPVIGFLNGASPEPFATRVAAFRKGLGETGYVESRNVTIEYRWAQNELERLPDMAADLVRRGVAAIVTTGSAPATRAAKAATGTIPIVFQTAADPIAIGLVASLNRPGGNATGISSTNSELGSKRLGLLHELLPGAARFAVLVNPNSPQTETFVADLRAAAPTLGREIEVVAATTSREIETAFASLVQKRTDALLIGPDAMFSTHRVQIVVWATRHAVPTIYPDREYAEAGGLMSYGSNIADQNRQLGIYTGRILKGEKPADLPVMRATKFEFIVNVQTARALSVDIPPTLLAIADEVIE